MLFHWIPAFAGMTNGGVAGMTNGGVAGMTNGGWGAGYFITF